MGATDHEIYKKRGRMNTQIGILLAAFVLIVSIATIARFSSIDTGKDENASNTEQTQ